jgi:hypothetical protein
VTKIVPGSTFILAKSWQLINAEIHSSPLRYLRFLDHQKTIRPVFGRPEYRPVISLRWPLGPPPFHVDGTMGTLLSGIAENSFLAHDFSYSATAVNVAIAGDYGHRFLCLEVKAPGPRQDRTKWGTPSGLAHYLCSLDMRGPTTQLFGPIRNVINGCPPDRISSAIAVSCLQASGPF